MFLKAQAVETVVTETPKNISYRLNNMYVRQCRHALVRDPKQFDVIVTSNNYGYILPMKPANNRINRQAAFGKSGVGQFRMYEPDTTVCT